MVGSVIYSLVRVVLDLWATGRGDQPELQAEVLAVRRQVQVLERQIKRVHWKSGLRPPASRGNPVVNGVRPVQRRERFGGLLSEYYRQAVAA